MSQTIWTSIQALIVCSVIITLSGYALLRNRGLTLIRSLSRDKSKITVRLLQRIEVAPRVYRLRFGLASDRHILGLPIGCHISLGATLISPISSDERYVSRQYTPVSTDFDDKGYFDLVVKVYRKNEHPNFPAGGMMSQYLETLPIGSMIDVKGPGGRIEYLEGGRFKIGSEKFCVKHVGMIAGGTGVTPMFQITKHVLNTRRGKDSLKLSLLYGNQHPGEILLREELERFTLDAPNQFTLGLTVDRLENDEKWSGHLGFVSEAMIKESMPRPSSDVLMLLCGPPPMVRSVTSMLQTMGYRADRIYAF